ncbi:S24/S26 family peptidase [Marinomonas posidonica]|uniref:Nickel-type superoxide dismutase maturation protease n=1 Tax=Marinomonas posidonica (strain CECT 7376 / NCIMB 14433 / IVIA-Po-181) TaxID=491952 RepID=F6CW94_MARPP|nr:S24/S26 family peptidase [Marinomonas posidonica]AEF55455.1 nickel-type superoxide dismutase maturation protease [Marinomonas posidonica IVIA-Po-181]
MLRFIKVQGESMAPNLHDGDFVFISRWYRKLKIGQLVVVDHALYGFIVKKILHIAPDGQLWLGGENNKSLQSERIGWVSPRRVIGKVIGRICASQSKCQ